MKEMPHRDREDMQVDCLVMAGSWSNRDEPRKGEDPGCESAANSTCEAFLGAKFCDGAIGCCGGARSRRKVMRRSRDDW